MDDDGKLRVLYTGQGLEGKLGILAESLDNAVTYTNKKAVLKDFHHDGHVFKHDGKWYTITSRIMRGQRKDGKGDAVVLFSSDDLEIWVEEGEIFRQPKTATNPEGFLEFPYLLFYEEKAVLLVGGDIRYYIGTFDWEKKKFIPDQPEGIRLDPINPFYCFNPMCVDNKGENGAERRLIMGLYAHIGDTGNGILPWYYTHTMPKVLTFAGDHMRQDPIPEMEKLRANCHCVDEIHLTEREKSLLDETFAPYLEISALFAPVEGDYGVNIAFGDQEMRVIYHAETERYEISGDVLHTGDVPAYPVQGDDLEMRIFIDSRLMEVYVNGQVCITATKAYTPDEMMVGVVSEKGEAHCKSLKVYSLNVTDSI